MFGCHSLCASDTALRLARFSFKGIRKGESDALTDKIKLIKGKIVTDALVKNTQLAVRKYFVDKGFLNTTVKPMQVRDSTLPGNAVALVFVVDKKRKVKINEIIFEGNKDFTDAKLRKRLKKTKQREIYHVFTPSKFVATQYEEDKDKLAKFYSKNGYRDFRIVSDTVYASTLRKAASTTTATLTGMATTCTLMPNSPAF